MSELGLQPDVTLRNIGGRITVTACGVPQMARGDVIRTIDGQSASDRERSLMDLFPWSTRQSGGLIADRYLLAGAGPLVVLGVRKPKGGDEQIELERNSPLAFVRPTPVMETSFGLLPSGLGYIDLTRLSLGDVDRAFDSLMGVPGIIFDLRGSVGSGAFPRVA